MPDCYLNFIHHFHVDLNWLLLALLWLVASLSQQGPRPQTGLTVTLTLQVSHGLVFSILHRFTIKGHLLSTNSMS